MLSWTIGQVTITRVVELETAFETAHGASFILNATPATLRHHAWLYPHFVDDADRLRMSVHALLVEAPGVRLIVDTCIGNDRPRQAIGGAALSTAFLQQLAAAGWDRHSVTTVVCTHLHVDHVGWNTMREGDRWVPTFPRARYLFGRHEMAHWRAEGDAEQQAILADAIQPILDAGLAELVETHHRISPEIVLIPTPGHTPGHVSVLIESDGARALITGDMVHHPCQLACPEWSSALDSDPQQAIRTRRDLLDACADEPVLLIGTHFPAPTAGYVRREGVGFRLIAEDTLRA